MNRVLPQTARDVAYQVDAYEWLKRNLPDLYRKVTEMVETRGGAR